MRMIEEYREMHYLDILRMERLTKLETKDLIEDFKIIKAFDDVDKRIFFSTSVSELRRHYE